MTIPATQHDARCVSWSSDDPTRCTCRDEQGHAPWCDGPWLAFDTESTGVDVTADRIVTATVITFRPGGGITARSWLADPGIDIPEAAAAVHGVTTEHARQHGRPAAEVVAEIASHLAAHWTPACPLIGYNASYDLSILAAELARHGHDPLTLHGPVVDPLVIDRGADRYRRGSRKLVDVARHYGIVLTDEQAHSADADALAAARVAWKLAKTYPAEVGGLTLAELHEQQKEWHLAWADNFGAYLVKQGKTDDVARDWPMRAGA